MEKSGYRRRRVFYGPGQAHYITYSCVGRRPLLSSDMVRQWVLEAIETARRRHNFDLYAYVIMPEHVHLVAKPRLENQGLSRFLYDLKRPVSWKAKQYLQRTGRREWLRRLTVKRGSRTVFRFWQPGGGFDRNIWREKSLLEVIEYIHANPVRRGLVSSPLDWVWSSARFWAGMDGVLLEMDPLPL